MSAATTATVRVELPQHLRTLARVPGEVAVEVPVPATIGGVLEALEARFPVLRGAIRDHGTLARRPFVRFYVCRRDWSHEPYGRELPAAIVNGEEPFLVIGAVAGG